MKKKKQNNKKVIPNIDWILTKVKPINTDKYFLRYGRTFIPVYKTKHEN